MPSLTEAFRRMREIVTELREEGPREEEVERARAYAAGARASSCRPDGVGAGRAQQSRLAQPSDLSLVRRHRRRLRGGAKVQ